MKIKRATIKNYYQENIDYLEVETATAKFRIISDGNNGIKISIITSDGNDVLSVQPKASNMIVLSQLTQ